MPIALPLLLFFLL